MLYVDALGSLNDDECESYEANLTKQRENWEKFHLVYRMSVSIGTKNKCVLTFLYTKKERKIATILACLETIIHVLLYKCM